MSNHNKIQKFVLTFLLVLVSGTASLSSAMEPEDSPGFTRPFDVFAVVWRGETEVEAGFREYFSQRGIPVRMTVRSLELDRRNAPPILEEIRRTKPDLVYTWGTGATLSILGPLNPEEPEKFVQDIPGMFVLVAYPISAKIVESFENTGRPVTGVSYLASIESQLKAIVDYGKFQKIAVIYDQTASNSRINVESLKENASKFGLELVVLPVPVGENGKPDPEKLTELVQTAKSEGAQLLYMGPDSFITRHSDAFTSEAIVAGLPTFASTQAPLNGSRAMFGLVSDYHTLGKLAATQAEKILIEKENPQDLPVVSLSRFKLWVTIDVAREVKMYPPMDMIAIATFKTSPQN